ncbi:hypothetical protein NONI108955_43375 [Nocardia ninae]
MPRPGVSRSSTSRSSPISTPAAASVLTAVRVARATRRPVTGRARICTHAAWPGASSSAAVIRSRTRSPEWSVLNGSPSRRPSRSSPPATIRRTPSAGGGSGGRAGSRVSVCAPGHAEAIARSINPGGIAPGTQSRIAAPSSGVTVYSNPRCGCPASTRAHAGRSCPIRCAQNASAPLASTSGGVSTVIWRARALSRRRGNRPSTRTAASTPPAANSTPIAVEDEKMSCSAAARSRRVAAGASSTRPSHPCSGLAMVMLTPPAPRARCRHGHPTAPTTTGVRAENSSPSLNSRCFRACAK